MKTTQENSIKQDKIVGPLLTIISLLIGTYFSLLFISPQSQYLGKFLMGFGTLYAGIVLTAYFIQYISEIYIQLIKKS